MCIRDRSMGNELDDIAPVANNLISGLKDYAATHFAHEEAYMESIHDPELDLQKKEHAAFTKKVNEFCLDTSSKEAAKASFNECISFLVRWLYHHILSNDMMIGKMCTPVNKENESSADADGKKLFTFTDKYKTGIEFIDEEHKRLFEIIDETYELIHDHFIHDKYDQIMSLLDQLKDYTEFHFHDEEEYMKNILKTIPEIEAFYTVGIHKRRIDEAEFQDAFRKMIDRNQETTVCFVVGSFYLAGMAKEFINQEEENVRL